MAGHFCSGSSIPASDVYKEDGILQISPASTNPKLTERGQWNTVPRLRPRRPAGRDRRRLLAQALQGQVAIVDDKSAYGKGLADETKKAINKGGMQEAMDEGLSTPAKRTTPR